MSGPVLVVGAGVAGLAAARTLIGRGLGVTVIDKGRGLGGRLATRRLGEGASFDHGAALFTPVSVGFRRRLEAWEADGLVERTAAGEPTFRPRGPSTSLAKSLASGLDVRLGAKGVALARDGSGFALALEDGATVRGAAAVVTPPVPQSLELLARGELLGRVPSALRSALEGVRYEPAFVLLVRLSRRASLPPSGVVEPRDGGPVSRIVENARDGGPSRLSVYARGSWAGERLDAAGEEVAAALESAAAGIAGFGASDVLARDLKRWRFARATASVPEEAPLAEIDGAPLVLAGDAFGAEGAGRPPLSGNTGLERAFLSGLAAAERILALRG